MIESRAIPSTVVVIVVCTRSSQIRPARTESNGTDQPSQYFSPTRRRGTEGTATPGPRREEKQRQHPAASPPAVATAISAAAAMGRRDATPTRSIWAVAKLDKSVSMESAASSTNQRPRSSSSSTSSSTVSSQRSGGKGRGLGSTGTVVDLELVQSTWRCVGNADHW